MAWAVRYTAPFRAASAAWVPRRTSVSRAEWVTWVEETVRPSTMPMA